MSSASAASAISPLSKTTPTLLHAVKEVAGVCTDWKLVVAGEGLELPKLRSFVDAHPEWKDRVRFVGLSNRVRELLNAMDVYVLSSVTEGISNSLLEAMSTGIAVVVTDTGGNPEVVEDGRSGLLFPVGDSQRLADHLVRLYARPEERNRLAQQARQRVSESFSLESMVRRTSSFTKVWCREPNRDRTRWQLSELLRLSRTLQTGGGLAIRPDFLPRSRVS